MLSKVLEMGVCFHRDLAFEEHGGDAPLLGPLREGKKMSLFRGIFMCILREM